MDAKAFDIKIEFQNAVTPFKDYLNFSDIPHLHQFYGIYSDSVLFFGLSDLYFRESERSKTLDIDGDKVRFLNRREQQTNAQGIDLLSFSMESFAKIKEGYKFNPEKLDNEEIVKELTEKFKLNIAEFDVASKDTKQLYDDFLQAIESIKKEGEIGAFNFIDSKLKELKKLRQGSARGRQSNIPWWKSLLLLFT